MTDGGLGLYTRRLNRLPDSMAAVRETLHRNASSGQGDADRLVWNILKCHLLLLLYVHLTGMIHFIWGDLFWCTVAVQGNQFPRRPLYRCYWTPWDMTCGLGGFCSVSCSQCRKCTCIILQVCVGDMVLFLDGEIFFPVILRCGTKTMLVDEVVNFLDHSQ